MLNKKSVLALVAILVITCASGQKGSQSPYSILGLGELNNGEYAPFVSMGGVLMANADSTIVNHMNPASYSYIYRNRPIFQIGLNGKLSTYTTESTSINRQHFGLNQFQLGLPIKNRWGAAFGLMPYSFTGYTVSNYDVNDGDTSKFINEGSGGISKIYLGVAYQPIKSAARTLSIGANVNYLFGSSREYRSYEYYYYSNSYNARVESGLRIADVLFDLGISYQQNFSKVKEGKTSASVSSIGFGFNYSPAIKARAYQDVFAFSYLGSYYESAPLIVDTVQYVVDDEGYVYIPESYRLGIEYRLMPSKGNSMLRIGADFGYQKWSSFYTNFSSVQSDSLRDRKSAGIGIEYTPSGSLKYYSTEPFFSRMSYRFGFNYTQTELRVENSLGERVNIDNYGMSFGVGLPVTVNRSTTNINFGATFGNLGTTENGLIQEKYVGLYFGVSISPGQGDLWFVKRKYD